MLMCHNVNDADFEHIVSLNDEQNIRQTKYTTNTHEENNKTTEQAEIKN